jgi:hypothetical protein
VCWRVFSEQLIIFLKNDAPVVTVKWAMPREYSADGFWPLGL